MYDVRQQPVRILLCVLLLIPSFGESRELVDELDFDHPPCERLLNLDFSNEVFVELGNDVGGIDDYNILVNLRKKKDWFSLDAHAEIYSKVFESSPLMEPYSFLITQSMFDRADPKNLDLSKENEKRVRNTILLYPKSELVPAALLGMAGFWTRQKKNIQALALYQSLKKDFPNHPLRCGFEIGIGEMSLTVGQEEAAKAAFEEAANLCKREKWQIVARMRLADMLWPSPESEKAYEKAFSQNLSRVETDLPEALYQIAEVKYRLRKYPSAAFYLDRFITSNKAIDSCQGYAAKRRADIQWRLSKNGPVVEGTYLSVYEKNPKEEIAVFSRMRSLLMGLRRVEHSERERRLRLVSEAIQNFKEKSLKEHLEIEKAVWWIDTGEYQALENLLSLPEEVQRKLKTGSFASIAYRGVAHALREVAQEGMEARGEKELAHAMDRMEVAFEWVKGNHESEALKKAFAKFAFKGLQTIFPKRRMNATVSHLKRWRHSPYWSEKQVSTAQMDEMARKILEQVTAESAQEKKLAESQLFLKDWAAFAPFFKSRNGFVLTYFESLQEGESRGLASLREDTEIAPDLKQFQWLTLAQVAFKQKHWEISQRYLKRITDKHLKPQATDLLRAIYFTNKKYREVYSIDKTLLANREGDEKTKVLEAMKGAVEEGKLWDLAPDLLKIAQKISLPNSKLAPYLYVAGKGLFERKQWKEAIRSFEKALTLEPTNPFAPEARYRLGKSFSRRGDRVKAKAAWEELSRLSDPVWSPIAQNELKLLAN